MSDQPHSSALDHAAAMLDHLRAQRPGDGHDLARAMIASAGVYLREVFGDHHARQVASDLLRPILGVEGVPEPMPGEAAPVAVPAATLH